MSNRKIYLVSAEVNGSCYYKIGYTSREVQTRVNEFKTGNCSNFNTIHVYEPLEFPVTIETSLHKHFRNKKINGEWFDLTQEDIDGFLDVCNEFYERFKLLKEMNTYMDDNNINFK